MLAKSLSGTTEFCKSDDAYEFTEVKASRVTVKSFGYDEAGRTTSVTTSAGTTTLAYNYESRVTQITYPSTATNTFTYNGLDTRVGKVDSGGTATYKRDGAYVTAPVVSDGSATYTPGISERRSSTTKYFGADRLGTDSLETNSSQAVTATKTYDAFGIPVGSTGSFASPFGFAGQHGYQEDVDSGLKLLGHRYYDASTGRFLTRDPVKDDRNWYGYCENNANYAVDPQGYGPVGTFVKVGREVWYWVGDKLEDVWDEVKRIGDGGDTIVDPGHRGGPDHMHTNPRDKHGKTHFTDAVEADRAAENSDEWKNWRDNPEGSIEDFLKLVASLLNPIGDFLEAGEAAGNAIDGPVKGARRGLNNFARQRWLDDEDGDLLD